MSLPRLSSVICVIAWCNVFGLAWYGLSLDDIGTYQHATMIFFFLVAITSSMIAFDNPQKRPPKNQNGRHQSQIEPSDN